ncbi:hypothetical protein UlMin_023992 [Ulmus minor]
MSHVDFEEAMELYIMLLECCNDERTYLIYYSLLGQRFCMINKQYSMIQRLETSKLRNVTNLFAHLLGTFSLPWHVLSCICLTEDTTSSSLLCDFLMLELFEHLGIHLLNKRLSDPTMQDSFESIFLRDNPKNSHFSINFFTSIGLSGITENLLEYLRNMPCLIMQQQRSTSDDEFRSS